MVELASMNMVELASLNSVVDKLAFKHVRTDWSCRLDEPEQCCWQRCWNGNLTVIYQQHCSYMIEHVGRVWWNNKIEQRCHNNHELCCCIKSGFACSNIREQHLSIREAVTICWTILSVILPILHVISSLTVLLQGLANNPVIAWE